MQSRCMGVWLTPNMVMSTIAKPVQAIPNVAAMMLLERNIIRAPSRCGCRVRLATTTTTTAIVRECL